MENRAASQDVVIGLQLWKNRVMRPEFLVLKLERKDIAGSGFLIHQKEVTFEGHLLRIPWLFLARWFVRSNSVFSENSSVEREHFVFTSEKEKINTSPCAERSDYAGPSKKSITEVLIACTVYVVTHCTCYFLQESNTSRVFHPKVGMMLKYHTEKEFTRNRPELC